MFFCAEEALANAEKLGLYKTFAEHPFLKGKKIQYTLQILF